jgi:hypothetical protein
MEMARLVETGDRPLAAPAAAAAAATAAGPTAAAQRAGTIPKDLVVALLARPTRRALPGLLAAVVAVVALGL